MEYAVILPSLWSYIQSFGETRAWWLGVVLTSFSIANMFASPFFGWGYLGVRQLALPPPPACSVKIASPPYLIHSM